MNLLPICLQIFLVVTDDGLIKVKLSQSDEIINTIIQNDIISVKIANVDEIINKLAFSPTSVIGGIFSGGKDSIKKEDIIDSIKEALGFYGDQADASLGEFILAALSTGRGLNINGTVPVMIDSISPKLGTGIPVRVK